MLLGLSCCHCDLLGDGDPRVSQQQAGRRLIRGLLLGQVFRQKRPQMEEKSSQARAMSLGPHGCSETVKQKDVYSLKSRWHLYPSLPPPHFLFTVRTILKFKALLSPFHILSPASRTSPVLGLRPCGLQSTSLPSCAWGPLGTSAVTPYRSGGPWHSA